MKQKLESNNGDYRLRCVRCYKIKPLEAIPHRAEEKKGVLHGIVGLVFACQKCKPFVCQGSVKIDFNN